MRKFPVGSRNRLKSIASAFKNKKRSSAEIIK
jgi:hypothetical protein